MLPHTSGRDNGVHRNQDALNTSTPQPVRDSLAFLVCSIPQGSSEEYGFIIEQDAVCGLLRMADA